MNMNSKIRKEARKTKLILVKKRKRNESLARR